MIEDKRIVQRNVWAITSLIIGVISLLLSFFAPVPFVPLNYCAFPLGAVSIVMGFIVQQSAKRINDVIAIQQGALGHRSRLRFLDDQYLLVFHCFLHRHRHSRRIVHRNPEWHIRNTHTLNDYEHDTRISSTF